MWQLNQQWQKEPLAEKISGLNNKKKPTERETKLGGEREREREYWPLLLWTTWKE